ncbi:MAG: excinuclease ABC subunit UvrC [Treponema sp.]|jgi:excinuclease ABC subunit C|nr:excinuclease ABC subunit UvrC [Treponema sp.]
MSDNSPNTLKETAQNAPSKPGVYIMRGEGAAGTTGEIIYIGKAKSLKNRLKSYFSGEKDIKTATLMRRVKSIETIIVPTEYDALLLENTLIKQHSPRYNISLKDGKTYPVIRVTHEDFPRIFRTRRIINDSSLYYGPFPNGQAVVAMMNIIDKLFPLRKCKSIKKRKAPCMYYHIGRCMAPCCNKINIDAYRIHVQRVQKLLEGETESLIIDLTAKMHELAKYLQFEKAAYFRNSIRSIEELAGEDNTVEDLNPEDRDYIAWASEGVLATFTVFSMRGGKMTGRDLFRTRSASNELESLGTFIIFYYDKTRPPPAKVYLQNLSYGEYGKHEDTEKFLKEICGYKPEFLQAKDKHNNAILAMARQNAAEDLRKRLKERGAGPALDELARALNLQSRPEKIEGFDISHLDGKFPVASLVSFKNGVPDKKNYRHYKLRTLGGKIDDFAGMREVIQRRYSRLLREGIDFPDLILVDGGIGQVNAAKEILDTLGAEIDIAGLAEQNEEIWLPYTKNPIILSKQSEALKVLQHIRDESHRFANNFNRKLRSMEYKNTK